VRPGPVGSIEACVYQSKRAVRPNVLGGMVPAPRALPLAVYLPVFALLFTEFVIGAEGQKLMEQFRYGVAWKDYPFKREYPERG